MQRRWSGAVRGAIRDIGSEAGLVDQRGRSPAKPDGLGGVVSMLTGEEGILARAGNFWRWEFSAVDMAAVFMR